MNKHLKSIFFVVLDILSVFLATNLALLLTGNLNLGHYITAYWHWLVGGCAFAVIFNAVCLLYTELWKYAGFSEAIRCCVSVVLFWVFCLIISLNYDAFSLAWSVISAFIYFIFLFGTRFASRVLNSLAVIGARKMLGEKKTRVLIMGAGSAGASLIREMRTSDKINMTPVCILDDDEIIIAIPSAGKKILKDIIEKCNQTKCKVKTVPGMFQFAKGQISVSDTREIDVQDLLGREQVVVNLSEIMGYIEGKVVLVTGGGGSIGSELCRQIAEHNPKQLIILDIYENNAYDIQQELLRKLPNLNLLVLIASVRDSKKINNVFRKYLPQIVFHAAAHKHVPLMETSPNEAVKNNVSGTLKVADAAGRFGTEKFILISTDKAVNPTNIMGATKRICEMIVQTMNKKYQTDYVAVRFGNVLGSNGSVIPLFKKQIAEGGPVTVTHKDIVRYFMTIPEAVSLVLQAGAYAHGGEIFVLDMGEPVRIYDLAVNMIRLSGLEPNKDIDIKITGLRPGEKLYEERLMEEEGLEKTQNKMISIGKPLEIDEENLFAKIEQLYVEAYNETDKMKELVNELVPTYKIDKRK